MCSVCMVDIFVQEFFLFLTVTVYLDTIGCVIGKNVCIRASGTKGYSFWQMLQVHIIKKIS